MKLTFQPEPKLMSFVVATRVFYCCFFHLWGDHYWALGIWTQAFFVDPLIASSALVGI